MLPIHPPDCINRNIVECKVASPFLQEASLSSINRNIVECKEDFNDNL